MFIRIGVKDWISVQLGFPVHSEGEEMESAKTGKTLKAVFSKERG